MLKAWIYSKNVLSLHRKKTLPYEEKKSSQQPAAAWHWVPWPNNRI